MKRETNTSGRIAKTYRACDENVLPKSIDLRIAHVVEITQVFRDEAADRHIELLLFTTALPPEDLKY
jgi:hypothetical protein